MRTRTIEWTDPQLILSAAAGRSGLEFLRAICEGAIAQPPISIATAEGRLTDERGRLLAHGTTTCLLMKR